MKLFLLGVGVEREGAKRVYRGGGGGEGEFVLPLLKA